jgi:hypothetical protein
MDNAVVLEFPARHSADSFRCATFALWKIFWRRNLLLFCTSDALCTAVVVLASYSLRIWSFLWFPAVFFVAQGLLFAYSFWKVSQRARKQLPAALDFRLTKSTVQYSNDRGSRTVPWDTFKFIRRDSKNLYLLVSKRAAMAVPVENLPEGAMDFIIAPIGDHKPT